MSRTFQPDDRIAHYRIVGPLGSGGMGEVHIAQDETLDRSVALKVLPPDLVRNEERVRRFIAEAKSASSLNHPNIVTIYEVGHDAVRPAGSEEGDGESIHYIAMELVRGETLDQLIHRARTDLRTLVGYLAQAAEGIAKAHAAGIVHRDLKPQNIMVSKDGFAKVLDFGLAKLIERSGESDAELAGAPTADYATGVGALLGTVAYMSPEQVTAQEVDHRSDIFAMGIILYEAAARRRPFVADSDVEVMHQILRDQPPPLEELSDEVPAALLRLIRRCLAKNPQQRLQSMKDLAIELREIVDEWDTLTVASSASRGGASSAAGLAPLRARRSRGLLVAVAAAVVILASFGLYRVLSRPGVPPEPAAPAADAIRMSSVMSLSDLREATLSDDGRYLAYVTSSGRTTDLLVRQVRTGSDVTIVRDSEVPITGISFSPDGDYLYFRNRDPELPNYSALFQVPSLGGTPRKVLFDVDSAATFSPDGKRVCFQRGLVQDKADSLVVADLESGKEHELLRVENPTRVVAAPAWSPDGASIAVGLLTISRGVRAWVEAIDVASGDHRPVGDTAWIGVDSLGWLPDGKAIVVAAFDLAAGSGTQLYRLGYPGGRAERVTSDLDGYSNVSVPSEGRSIAAVRRSTVSNMWVADVDTENDVTPLTFASGSQASMGAIAPLPGGATSFTAPRENRFFLWWIDADGSGRRQLTTKGVFVLDANWSAQTGIVFTQVDQNPETVAHIWRIQPDGTGLEQVTDGDGEQVVDVSPTGKSLLFTRWDRPGELWMRKLGVGEPTRISERSSEQPLFSPDGKRVLYTTLDDQGDGRFYPVRRVITPGSDASEISFRLPPGAFDVRWAPDGAAVTFIDRGRGWNLMRKPLPDGDIEPITTFKDGQVIGHCWSVDGARLAIHRRIGQQQSLWQLRPGTTEPTMVVDYRTGSLSRYHWAPDAPLLYYAYSTSSQDVVMLSGIH